MIELTIIHLIYHLIIYHLMIYHLISLNSQSTISHLSTVSISTPPGLYSIMRWDDGKLWDEIIYLFNDQPHTIYHLMISHLNVDEMIFLISSTKIVRIKTLKWDGRWDGKNLSHFYDIKIRLLFSQYHLNSLFFPPSMRSDDMVSRETDHFVDQ